MKTNYLLTLVLALFTNIAFAQQKVTIKAGSIVPLQSSTYVRAADVSEGQTVDFNVIQDVNVDGICVIPRGTLVKGIVSEARRSTIAGTKGRLVIAINKLILPNGEPLYFSNSDVRIYGRNRTPLAVVLACFCWPCIFIPGSKAAMPAGYEVLAMVAANTTIVVE